VVNKYLGGTGKYGLSFGFLVFKNISFENEIMTINKQLYLCDLPLELVGFIISQPINLPNTGTAKP